MKIKPNLILMLFALATMAFSLVACDTRPIPGNSIITMYNSNMEETREFQPMDTMYVKVAGMKANSFYRVSVLDADKDLVTMIEARTNDEGVIDPVPLWYDMGLKLSEPGSTLPPTVVWPEGLQPSAFKIKVESIEDNGESTNFTQDMWIVYTKSDTQANAQPVIYACYREDIPVKAVGGIFYPENAFKETGTMDLNGNPDPKTKVYVKADRVPTSINNNTVDINSVDFYVIKFTGGTLTNGEPLFDTDRFVTRITNIPVNEDGTIDGTLLWDLNDGPQVINPDQSNMAYSIVMDVDRNGVYDQGLDRNTDGIVDDFIDGVDGNGAPGFIIQNTPANDVFVRITDENGNEVNAIPESGANTKQLKINIDNAPVPLDQPIGIYLIDSNETGTVSFDVPDDHPDVRNMGINGEGDIALSAPDAEDQLAFKFLPLLKSYPLVNTKAVTDDYTFSEGAPAGDRRLDIVIDLDNDGTFDKDTDIFIEDGVTILDVPAISEYKTCTDAAGNSQSQYFNETGTAGGNTLVYLKSEQAPEHDFDAFVFNHKNWAPGQFLSGSVIRKSFSGNGTNLLWDLNNDFTVINPTLANNTFDIVIDNNMDGMYDAGDDILTIVILNTQTNTYPRVSYVNIASGGSFGNTWEQHWTIYSEFCDYRDVFISSGLDTNPYGAGYGVKAVFNPYFSWFCSPDPEIEIEGLYYGLYVDVYIVNADSFNLAVFGNPNELNDAVDVTGRHSTLVVQPSCYNGAGMMNIWPAAMTPGSYYVIVDVNRNGIIDEGVDIIDAVKEDGTTILDNPATVGFTVE